MMIVSIMFRVFVCTIDWMFGEPSNLAYNTLSKIIALVLRHPVHGIIPFRYMFLWQFGPISELFIHPSNNNYCQKIYSNKKHLLKKVEAYIKVIHFYDNVFDLCMRLWMELCLNYEQSKHLFRWLIIVQSIIYNYMNSRELYSLFNIDLFCLLVGAKTL